MDIWELPKDDLAYLYTAYGASIVLLVAFGLASEVRSKRALRWGALFIGLVTAIGTVVCLNFDCITELFIPPLRGAHAHILKGIYLYVAFSMLPLSLLFLSMLLRDRMMKSVRSGMPRKNWLVTAVRKEFLKRNNDPELAELLEAQIEKGFHAAGLVSDSSWVEKLRKDVAHGAGFYDHERRTLVLDISPNVALIFDIMSAPPFIKPRV